MKTILKLNEEQNGLKLIQVNDGFAVIKNNPELKANVFIYSVLYGIGKIIRDYGGKDGEGKTGWKPLIAEFQNSTTQQMYHRNGIWQKGKHEDVSAHNCKLILFATPNLNLEGVPEIEEKVYSPYSEPSFLSESAALRNAFRQGYKQAQQTMLTEEQVREALRKQKETNGMNQRNQFSYKYKSEDEIIQSLKQPKIEITFENNKPVKAVML